MDSSLDLILNQKLSQWSWDGPYDAGEESPDYSNTIAFAKDIPLESNQELRCKIFVQPDEDFSVSTGRGQRSGGWMIDVEVVLVTWKGSEDEERWFYHTEKPAKSEEEAMAFAEKMKKFIDGKTLSELEKIPKSGKLGMSTYKEQIREAFSQSASESDIRDAFNTSSGWVTLGFPDDFKRDKFLGALVKAGVRKGSEITVDSEKLSVKAAPVKRLQLQGPIARGLQKLEAGLAPDARSMAPTNPSFWRRESAGSEDCVPSMKEVYGLNEDPLDWKKSFKKAKDRLSKTGIPGIAADVDVPKGPKKPQKARPARAGGPQDDPLKTSTTAELFETDSGSYFLAKGIGGRHHVTYVSGDYRLARDLGDHGSRKEAIDAVLAHHDKTQGGLGEGEEENY